MIPDTYTLDVTTTFRAVEGLILSEVPGKNQAGFWCAGPAGAPRQLGPQNGLEDRAAPITLVHTGAREHRVRRFVCRWRTARLAEPGVPAEGGAFGRLLEGVAKSGTRSAFKDKLDLEKIIQLRGPDQFKETVIEAGQVGQGGKNSVAELGPRPALGEG